MKLKMRGKFIRSPSCLAHDRSRTRQEVEQDLKYRSKQTYVTRTVAAQVSGVSRHAVTVKPTNFVDARRAVTARLTCTLVDVCW